MLDKLGEILALFFQDVFDKSSNGLKEFSEKTGWIVDIEIISNYKLLNRLQELFEKGQFDKAAKLYKRYIINFYTEDKFVKLENKWIQNDTLKQRIEILLQVLKAHRLEMYYVSVPTMLAQIEGYIWEINKYSGRIHQKKLKEFINNQEHLSIFTESISSYIENVIFVSFNLDENLNSEISRNAILHGYDVLYGTKEISLKLIIVMNVLQQFYMNISSPKIDDEHSE
ncbi:hypothetical protein [Paenibacillus wulumuqiensis]|uniref:hypothetical protein n=1 Tax=Paenibacillus wulumuqiensis TaxID=1567107 RepID=UPI00061976EE|nr:hypothetical protein [Paenibacillus wulumuqiensis]